MKTGQAANRNAWIDAAYDLLINAGVEAVKIVPLAKRMGTSRTSFYWLFKDREEVLHALLERWEQQNTCALIQQTEAYAEHIVEAVLNVFDCWFDPALFDSEFEYAVRSWSLQKGDVTERVRRADERRLDAIRQMYRRHGFDALEADTRARTLYLIQIGYISMHTRESWDTRLARVPHYVTIFTGEPCTSGDLERFAARHQAASEHSSEHDPDRDKGKEQHRQGGASAWT